MVVDKIKPSFLWKFRDVQKDIDRKFDTCQKKEIVYWIFFKDTLHVLNAHFNLTNNICVL